MAGDEPILKGRAGKWDAQTTNPAPFITANGSALLVYRGLNGIGTDRIGVARATSWNGTYERLVENPVFGQCGNWTPHGGASTNCTAHDWGEKIARLKGTWVCDDCIGWAEDPFVWQSQRGYHMLTHNLHGVGGRATPWWVGMAFSADYINWQYSTVPAATNTYTSSVDGTNVTLRGRERPQLLLSAGEDRTPLALFSGAVHASSGGSSAGHSGTFTFVQGTAALAAERQPA
jgi:hypothetical protein